MSAVEAKAASISPPDEVIVRATVSTAEHIKLPKTWAKSYITVHAEGLDVFVIVDKASTTAPIATATSSTDGDGYMQPASGGCKRIPVDQERDFNLDELDARQDVEDVYVHHISSGTTGKIRIERSSGPKN